MKVILIFMAISVIIALMNADLKKNKLAEETGNPNKHNKDFKRNIKAAKSLNKDLEEKMEKLEGQKEINGAYDRYLTKKKANGPVRLNRNY